MADDHDEQVESRLFWSGGSQAVRIPAAFRLEGERVHVHRQGKALVIEPIDDADTWGTFWDDIKPLSEPIVRRDPGTVDKRESL